MENTSKYLKPSRENKIYDLICSLFLFSLFVMPQYFGIPVPFFDLTILRIMIIAMLLMIISDDQRKKDFASLFISKKYAIVFVPYIIVLSYTMVFRVDINAFLNPMMEFLGMFLTIYIIKFRFGVEKTINLINKYMYLLTMLGIVEFIMKRTPFSYLVTIKGIYTGAFIRSGQYRIMGPCSHSLGYGLLLVAIAPLCCYNAKDKRMDLFNKPFLLILILMNVFLTGSRSTLAVFLLELGLIFLFTDRQSKKKCILLLSAVVMVLVMFLTVFHNTNLARYMMLQITTLVDSLFGTQLSLAYGANLNSLSSSANYREQLKLIFKVPWLNPILGIGRKRAFSGLVNGSYIKSIDSFYIAEYVRYAYPGLFAFVFALIYYIIKMLKQIREKNSVLVKCLLIATCCYLLNLKWVDSLQTFKYLYIVFAIFVVLYDEDETTKNYKYRQERHKSKYIRG